MEFPGGCLCGGTRYVVHARPQAINDCHCLDCRRSSGAPYVTWGGLRCTAFELTSGTIREVEHADRLRGFASCCGTQLFMQDAPDSPELEITIASLDDPAPFPPEKVIWIEDKLPWVIIDPSLPSFARNSTSDESGH